MILSFVEEMNKILSDTDTYVPLYYDPTGKSKKELDKLIEAGFDDVLINKREREHIWSPEYRSYTCTP